VGKTLRLGFIGIVTRDWDLAQFYRAMGVAIDVGRVFGPSAPRKS
jgi:hypothetical protein